MKVHILSMVLTACLETRAMPSSGRRCLYLMMANESLLELEVAARLAIPNVEPSKSSNTANPQNLSSKSGARCTALLKGIDLVGMCPWTPMACVLPLVRREATVVPALLKCMNTMGRTGLSTAMQSLAPSRADLALPSRCLKTVAHWQSVHLQRRTMRTCRTRAAFRFTQ